MNCRFPSKIEEQVMGTERYWLERSTLSQVRFYGNNEYSTAAV